MMAPGYKQYSHAIYGTVATVALLDMCTARCHATWCRDQSDTWRCTAIWI